MTRFIPMCLSLFTRFRTARARYRVLRLIDDLGLTDEVTVEFSRPRVQYIPTAR